MGYLNASRLRCTPTENPLISRLVSLVWSERSRDVGIDRQGRQSSAGPALIGPELVRGPTPVTRPMLSAISTNHLWRTASFPGHTETPCSSWLDGLSITETLFCGWPPRLPLSGPLCVDWCSSAGGCLHGLGVEGSRRANVVMSGG